MFACTIWKAQGLTLPRVIIELTRGSSCTLPLLYTTLDSLPNLTHSTAVAEYLAGLRGERSGKFSFPRVEACRRAGGLAAAGTMAWPVVLPQLLWVLWVLWVPT